MTKLYLAVWLRMQDLTRERDRGDGPVPTSIIIAGLAVLAAAVVAWATTKANNAMNSAP
ncbi:hypothetical protein [Cryptosporangium sp. NPDC051539]|uniref:hypothetical protein n=1 Tax=Cryptosporangium sp. NPDC051539 TaxID=3363962 RepID=UPI0037BA4C3D